ncbi:MAG: hypothetical protein KDK23_05220 [Leptospiraceae bacterium]|nr:hypothetical protein [Leptospiraceae bacterium]
MIFPVFFFALFSVRPSFSNKAGESTWSGPAPGIRHTIDPLAFLLALVLLSFALCPMPAQARESSTESSEQYSIWPEVFLPGYNAFRNESYISGSFLLIGRILTAYSAYYYHARYINYESAARAARLADIYYGPGLEYADPYSGDFLSSQDLQNRAGRSQNYYHLSLALHAGLTAAGLFQGYRIQQDLQERNLKELEIRGLRQVPMASFQYSWKLSFDGEPRIWPTNPAARQWAWPAH